MDAAPPPDAMPEITVDDDNGLPRAAMEDVE
jgi:hypothetical protein